VIFYLKIRASLDPAINEANPETWQELLAVLARRQYELRPIFPRSVDFLRYQIPLYFDYLFGQIGPFESRVPGQFGHPVLSILTFLLAIVGSAYHFIADRKTWVFFLGVYLTTSLGLLVYLNFPLGNSQALDVTGVIREVRERDYFFVVSYVFLALWAGVGIFSLAGEAWRRARRHAFASLEIVVATVVLLLLPALVFALNYHQSDRRGNTIPRDFAYNVLQSVEPWAILFTNGDNDTFPLWYLQEVEGVRRDVSVVNLALMNTHWYLRQLSEKVFTAGVTPVGADDVMLAEHGVEVGPKPDHELIDYTGGREDPLTRIGFILDEETSLDVAGIEVELPANSILRRQDIGVLQVIRKNLGRRPIYFSVTVPDDGKVHLFDNLLREGIVDRVRESRASDLAQNGERVVPMQPPERSWINVPRTELLLESVYRYEGIEDPDIYKDATARALIGNYGATFLQLAAAQARQGDTESAIPSLTRGHSILGRDPDHDAYLTSLLNVFAVSGSYAQIDSVLRGAEDRRGRLDDRYYKTAAYNAAVVGHYEVADRLLQKYFREDVTAVEPELWIDMAEMAITAADTEQGMKFLTRAIRVDPNNRRAFLRYINLANAIGNDVLTKTFLYQWVKSHPGDTVTTRMYGEFLDTDDFPDELRWENVVRGPSAAVDTAPGGE
jgi:tetratricopeptide (TPR) repeat protein